MKYVAFDLGASSGKLFEGQLRGNSLQIAPVYSFPNGVVCLRDGMYWDFLRIFSELVTGLRRAEASGQVDSLGVDSYNNDFSLIDANGEMLIPVRSYRDSRTQKHWDAIFGIMPMREVYMHSGNQIAPFNTLMQLAAMNLNGQHFLLENAHRLLMLPDLLGYYITGRIGIEYTVAAETELLNLATKQWIEPIFAAYDIPRRLMPELRMPGTILGPSTPEFNAQHHLRGFDFVNVCEHDTASAFLASPLDRDAILISSGTWALVGLETVAPVVNDFTYRSNIANEGGLDGHHRLLRNVMGSWLIQELRRDYALDGLELDFPTIQKLALEAAPFRFPLDPDAPEFYMPNDMRRKIRDVSLRLNGAAPETPGEYFRCVYEALVMKYRYCIELLETAVGRSYGTVNIFGGGCQDQLCNQFVADACGRRVVAGPIDASSIGNIVVQMLAHGELSNMEEAKAVIRSSFDFMEFAPKAYDEWNRHYPDFLRLFEGNSPA